MAKPTFANEKGKKEPAASFAEPQTIAARVLEAVRPHTGKLLAVVGGVVIAVVGLAIYTSLASRKAARATDEFGRLIAEANAKVDEAGPDIELLDPSGSVPTPDKAKYRTYAERSQQALEVRKSLDLGSTQVALSAKLVEAALLYDAGKSDDAVAAYRTFLGGEHDPFLAATAREGIGYALETKALAQTDAAARNAGLDETLRAFAEIATGEKEPLYSVALYHQARIKALKGDKAGAVALYKKAIEATPTPQLSDEINNRLALLEAK